MSKFEVISQKPSNIRFLAKMAIFWQFLAKEEQKINFFQKSAWNIFLPYLSPTQVQTIRTSRKLKGPTVSVKVRTADSQI